MNSLFGNNASSDVRPGAFCSPTELLRAHKNQRELADITIRAISKDARVGVAKWRAGFEGSIRSGRGLIFVAVQRGALEFSEINAHVTTGEAIILGSKQPTYKVHIPDATDAVIFAISRRTFLQHLRTRYDDEHVRAHAVNCVIREKVKILDSAIQLSFQLVTLLESASARRLGDVTSAAIERALSFYLYEANLTANIKAPGIIEENAETKPTARHIVRPQSVRAAEEFISANLAEIESISEIAEASNISTRTLLRGFKSFLGVGPMEYLRDKRLRIARSALRDIDDTRPVRDIAESVGFKSYSSFWSHYNEAYQESPSTTRKLARNPLPSEIETKGKK